MKQTNAPKPVKGNQDLNLNHLKAFHHPAGSKTSSMIIVPIDEKSASISIDFTGDNLPDYAGSCIELNNANWSGLLNDGNLTFNALSRTELADGCFVVQLKSGENNITIGSRPIDLRENNQPNIIPLKAFSSDEALFQSMTELVFLLYPNIIKNTGKIEISSVRIEMNSETQNSERVAGDKKHPEHSTDSDSAIDSEHKVMRFIKKHIPWVFSGIGVPVLLLIINLIFGAIQSGDPVGQSEKQEAAESSSSAPTITIDITDLPDDSEMTAFKTIPDNPTPEGFLSTNDIFVILNRTDQYFDDEGVPHNTHYGYSSVNVITQNNRDTKAVLSKFTAHVENYSVDETPHFDFIAYVNDGVLDVYVHNNGWGPAEDYCFALSFNHYLPYLDIKTPLNQFVIKSDRLVTVIDQIGSRDIKRLFSISRDDFDSSFTSPDQGISVEIFFSGELSDYKGSGRASMRDRLGYYDIYLTDSGFVARREEDLPLGSLLLDTIYHLTVNKDGKYEYAITHTADEYDLDYFTIDIDSDKSCTFDLTVSIVYDSGKSVASSVIPVSITRYTDLADIDTLHEINLE